MNSVLVMTAAEGIPPLLALLALIPAGVVPDFLQPLILTLGL
jgi:hypothetical protein